MHIFYLFSIYAIGLWRVYEPTPTMLQSFTMKTFLVGGFQKSYDKTDYGSKNPPPPSNTVGLNKMFNHLIMFLWICFYEGYSLDQIKMTEWIWPKTVNMMEKLTTTNTIMVSLTEIIINITTMMNLSVWIWPKVKIIKILL